MKRLMTCLCALTWFVSLTLGLGSVTTVAMAEDVARPNVLLIVSDDQRPDTIAALGNSNIETPNLDKLARTGAVFTRAISPNPICTPSRAEILTGCSGFRNGVLDFGRMIDPKLPTWANSMKAAGYRTAYVGKWHNNGLPQTHGYQVTGGLYKGGGGKWWVDQNDHHGRPVTGYRGWIFHTDDGEKLPDKGVGLTPDISAKFADAAIELIRQPSEQPFFVHLNFTAPHDPLLMPPKYDGKYDPAKIPLPKNFLAEHPFDHGNFSGRDEKLLPWPRTSDDVRADLAVYYAVISHMDEQIGRVIQSLKESGQWEKTLVLFTSDHGLAMGSHGLRGKQNMYEHTVNVPMILHGPGVPQGKRFAAQVYLRDMFPTVCELAGVPMPDGIDGRSFAAVLRGEKNAIHDFAFCYFRDVQRMVRTDEWKLVHYPKISRTQLFNVKNDPLELQDLADSAELAKTRADLESKLLAKQKQSRDPLLAK